MSRLKEKYEKEIIPELIKNKRYSNVMAVPKIKKICLNSGIGNRKQDKDLEKIVFKQMEAITGQRPQITKAKKAISGFKLREGENVGVRLTLRGRIMYDFLDRLINIALPRIRDFRGLAEKGFDGRGNYTMGIKEQAAFPEIDIDRTEKFFGLEITIVTNAKTNAESKELLTAFGMPLIKSEARNPTAPDTADGGHGGRESETISKH